MNDEYKTSSLDMGKRIAGRRKQLHLIQEQAAELAGLSYQFFACVERGHKNIRAESIIKLSRSMDVSTDYILLGKSTDIDRSYLLKLIEPLNEYNSNVWRKLLRIT